MRCRVTGCVLLTVAAAVGAAAGGGGGWAMGGSDGACGSPGTGVSTRLGWRAVLGVGGRRGVVVAGMRRAAVLVAGVVGVLAVAAGPARASFVSEFAAPTPSSGP